MTAATRVAGGWRVELLDTATGETETVSAKMLVNAAGPWVDSALAGSGDSEDMHRVRLVKGSHIVVPRLYEDPRCFFFQNSDGRIFFALPYERDFTLIGTTDADFSGDPGKVRISQEETAYLLAAANSYFSRSLNADDIVWTYSGVRPLYDDGASQAQEATRDYVLKRSGAPALLTVIGGKITTYRRLAEAALEHIEDALGRRGGSWTAGAPLPGGDFPVDGFKDQLEALMRDYPFLDPALAARLMRLYGTLARDILGTAKSDEELGLHFGAGLYEVEVHHLLEKEWAREVDDVLWRRTKLGLRDVDKLALAEFMAHHGLREKSTSP